MAQAKIRDQYAEFMRRQLLGPGYGKLPGLADDKDDIETEVVPRVPNRVYSLGILFPEKTPADKEETEADPEPAPDITGDETPAAVDETPDAVDANVNVAEQDDGNQPPPDDGNQDESVDLQAPERPSSMGLCFLAEGDVSEIRVRLSYATYRPAKPEDCSVALPANFDGNAFPAHDPLFDWSFLRQETGKLRFASLDEAESEGRQDDLKKRMDEALEALKKKRDELREREAAANEPRSPELQSVYDRLMALHALNGQLHRGFVRIPRKFVFVCSFPSPPPGKVARVTGTTLAPTGDGPVPEVSALRTDLGGGVYSFAVTVVNKTGVGGKTPVSSGSMFQPELSVSTEDNHDRFVFRPDSLLAGRLPDRSAEELSLDLLYRKRQSFASGMGVSAEWNVDDAGKGVVRTEFLPSCDIPQMSFSLPADVRVHEKVLSMKWLSALDDGAFDEKATALRGIVDGYGAWLAARQAEADDVDPDLRPAADGNLELCHEARRRMLEGIDILETDENARQAFLWANEAMYMQRLHSNFRNATADLPRDAGDPKIKEFFDHAADEPAYATLDDWLAQTYRTIPSVRNDRYEWRPFQLAFLLLSVRSIVQDDSPDRGILDLIWFPTGGGKTEAYLGLTAFAIFFRRLKHGGMNHNGTAVLMRYTLRLLTTQQFNRASTLICACDRIRSWHEDRLGKSNHPISIGLWVGSAHTPNAKTDAQKMVDALNLARNERTVESNLKFQVLKCPWCGTSFVKRDVEAPHPIGQWGYVFEKKANSFRMVCPHPGCSFSKGNRGQGRLPVQVVDEELYDNPPTLLFATVDKFAMLPWRGDSYKFFGVGKNCRPPELVIQDELHLISGPLGSLVGLYESCVDFLSGLARDGVKPKIIASTATIRRAGEQCRALYDRAMVRQFPPPALDVSDSFFARERPVDADNPGRRYLGVMASASTKASMETTILAELLSHIHVRKDWSATEKDPYWTVTAYFNALRELARCSSLVADMVAQQIKSAEVELFQPFPRHISFTELTSRITSSQLTKTLSELESAHYPTDETGKPGSFPKDLVLATNMIAAGIDVARLNLMLVVGQPKLSSEYIQVTSRIGRHDPGLAIVLFDPCSSRDRSHFERFKAFHARFYKMVEPTGVTPFSRPALERGIQAVFLALLRAKERLSNNNQAHKLDTQWDRWSTDIESIVEYLQTRSDAVHEALGLQPESIRDLLDLELIRHLASDPNAVFGELGQRHNNPTILSRPPVPRGSAVPALTSLRNVEESLGVDVLTP